MKSSKKSPFVLNFLHMLFRYFTCCNSSDEHSVDKPLPRKGKPGKEKNKFKPSLPRKGKPGKEKNNFKPLPRKGKPGKEKNNRQDVPGVSKCHSKSSDYTHLQSVSEEAKPLTPKASLNSEHAPCPRIVRGSKHQAQIQSNYSGNQCTSIALYSLFLHTFMRVDSWITDSIDAILVLGTELHEYFREVAKLSTNPDKRVALDDFPEDFSVNEQYIGRSRALGFGLVRCVDDKTDLQVFPDLKRFLEDCFAQGLSSVVLTVGDFSISVMAHAGRFWLFDSHSCDRTGGKSLLSLQEGKACLLSFPTPQYLVTHVEKQFGNLQYVGRAFSFCRVDSLCENESSSDQVPQVSTVEERTELEVPESPVDEPTEVCGFMVSDTNHSASDRRR